MSNPSISARPRGENERARWRMEERRDKEREEFTLDRSDEFTYNNQLHCTP